MTQRADVTAPCAVRCLAKPTAQVDSSVFEVAVGVTIVYSTITMVLEEALVTGDFLKRHHRKLSHIVVPI